MPASLRFETSSQITGTGILEIIFGPEMDVVRDYLEKGKCQTFTGTNAIMLTSFLAQNIEACAITSFFENNSYEFTFQPGFQYFFELWGASGGVGGYGDSKPPKPGFGSFVSGRIEVTKKQKSFLIIGGQGKPNNGSIPAKGGYNGGADGAIDDIDGNGPAGGSGGSTDIRLFFEKGKEMTEEENLQSLRSRVMVAAGGASNGCCFEGFGGDGGNGGTIQGEQGKIGDPVYGPLPGGLGGYPGSSFGFGETGTPGQEAGGSGGSGYFGGKGGLGIPANHATQGGSGGGGGSSYISGYPGCKTVDYDGTLLDSEFHPSGLIFSNTTMIAGAMEMPDESGNLVNGNEGNGKAIILKIPGLSSLFTKTKVEKLRHQRLPVFLIDKLLFYL